MKQWLVLALAGLLILVGLTSAALSYIALNMAGGFDSTAALLALGSLITLVPAIVLMRVKGKTSTQRALRALPTDMAQLEAAIILLSAALFVAAVMAPLTYQQLAREDAQPGQSAIISTFPIALFRSSLQSSHASMGALGPSIPIFLLAFFLAYAGWRVFRAKSS